MAALRERWFSIRNSLWFIPSLFTLVAVGLSALLVELDQRLAGTLTDIPLFSLSVSGAREVLSAIASGMITVTGVVFSITMVALQLASSQFSPRVLRTFMGDRGNQIVLGAFISTFTYCLLVLRTVRSEGEDLNRFVPTLSVMVAIGLALLSVGFLIYFIDHAAHSIQVSTIIDRATSDTLRLVERLFPEPVGRPVEAPLDPPLPQTQPVTVTADAAGYLRTVDDGTLFSLAEKGGFVVRMEPRVGEFILPGAPLASVWPVEKVTDEVIDCVRDAFLTGYERSLQQDFEYGIRQVVDVAVKSLSPGVNDPTSAINCVDRLAEILVTLGNRAMPSRVRASKDGKVCFIARETSFERAVGLCYDQIRVYCVRDPGVTSYLLGTLRRIAALVPADRRAPLAEHAEAILRVIDDTIAEPSDRARVAARGRAAIIQARGGDLPPGVLAG